MKTYGSFYHPVEPAKYLQYQPHHKEEEQDLHKIPGTPGHDYPIYHEVPQTSFHCGNVPAVPGMVRFISLYLDYGHLMVFSFILSSKYANVETGCQAYHVCHDGREGHQGATFLCTNGTIFNQKEFSK